MKKQISPATKAHLFFLIGFVGVALGLAVLALDSNLQAQSSISPDSLQPSAATHDTRAGLQEGLEKLIESWTANQIAPPVETVSSAPPTRSSFMASWDAVNGAQGYLLDVSTSNSFSSYVNGYHGLDVGNVNGRAVTGLNPGTTYYYRVRPYTAATSGSYSNVTTATTQASTGLIINPTFDSSITDNPNSAAIEATINRAIRIYESLFSDPITIEILFRYSTNGPGPEPSPTPFPSGVLSASRSVVYTVPWSRFIGALKADATTSNDKRANTSLPASALSTNISPSSANGRAVGLNTRPAMFPNGAIRQGGPFDGIVTLNSAVPFWFTRPLISGSFDAQRTFEHEIDEVIGLGSYLNTPSAPSPCVSYEAESPICPPAAPAGEQCSIVAGGAEIQSCPTCSGGGDVGFVGNNSGTLQINGISANASGRLNVRIWYTNGDAVRYALLSVNGGLGTSLTFPSTGSFQTLGSIQTTLILSPGSDNTLKFYNPIVGDWAPDFDRIEVTCTNPPRATLRPQDLFSWSSPGVRNLTLDGSRYFSIDSGSTRIVGFNQTPPGDFGDWLSEACPQRHPFVQNAFICRNQFSDISATSPEGINLDVIGYDLTNRSDGGMPTDFNNDGHSDYLLYNAGTRRTVIWYMHGNVHFASGNGPTLPAGWSVVSVADFNRDGHPDYLLYNPATRATVIWYLVGATFLGANHGPQLVSGWEVVGTGDFNGNGGPDLVLYRASTHETAIWYLNNNVRVGSARGPMIPGGWSVIAVADFNRDGNPDYLLFKPSTGQSVIWYLSGVTRTTSRSGPTIPAGYALVGVADFDGNGSPDYVLYNSSTDQTTISYLNNFQLIGRALGPTLPGGWSLAAP